jgi:hypothetical protein
MIIRPGELILLDIHRNTTYTDIVRSRDFQHPFTVYDIDNQLNINGTWLFILFYSKLMKFYSHQTFPMMLLHLTLTNHPL